MVLVVLFPSPMVTNIMNIMGISFILFRLCFFIFDVLCLKWIQCERIHYSRIACNFIIIVIPSKSAMVPFFSVSRAYFTRPIFYRLYSSFMCVCIIIVFLFLTERFSLKRDSRVAAMVLWSLHFSFENNVYGTNKIFWEEHQ